VGAVRGFGPDAGDQDIAGPLGRFGDTGGHRQDLDSAGAYVVAGPEGEDLSHAIGASNANRHDPSFQTYVAEPANEEAATLSAGGHPNSNEPGRKREDDSNLVAYSVQPGTVASDGPNTLSARETDEAEPLTASDHKKSDRGTVVGFLAGSSPATGGVGAEEESPTLKPPSPSGGGQPTAVAFTKTHGSQDTEDPELWEETDTMRPLDSTAFATDVVVEAPEVSATLKARSASGGTGEGLRTTDVDQTLVTETEEVGALQTGSTPHGHGQAGVNDQAVAAGHVVAVPQAFESRIARNGRGAPSDEVPPLKAESGADGRGDGAPMVVAPEEPQTFDWQVSGGGDSFKGKGRTWIEDKPGETRSLQSTKTLAVHQPSSAVRRLAPVECERLQGFPDAWTLLPDGPTPDGPRYSALGDAVTVNVAYWAVRRLIRRRELGLE
jgi:hypothetical protein